MRAVAVRILLLTIGLAAGELGLDALAHGTNTALPMLAVALVALVAGSRGFMAPLLGGQAREEGRPR